MIEKAQLAVVDPSETVFQDQVRPTDTLPFWCDWTLSPSDLGYHWNPNGESQYLNGTAMDL